MSHKNRKNNTELIQNAINFALKIPGVRVDRNAFLRSNLRTLGKTELLDSKRTTEIYKITELDKVAKSVIKRHTAEVVALSAASGVPGGFAAIPLSVADIGQFYCQFFITAQKLAYIYGMPDLNNGEEDFDENTYQFLISCLGVSVGVEAASHLFYKLSNTLMKEAGKRVVEMEEEKILKNIVVKIIEALGKKATDTAIKKFFSKIVPVISGLISGTLTYISFKPMSKKLHKKIRHSLLTEGL